VLRSFYLAAGLLWAVIVLPLLILGLGYSSLENVLAERNALAFILKTGFMLLPIIFVAGAVADYRIRRRNRG